MSKTSYAMNKNDEAVTYYDKAMKLDPEKAVNFSYLGDPGASARASATTDQKVFFFE